MGSPVPDLQLTSSLKLQRKLRAGTMGSVWVAEHLTLKTQFAVKFMSPGLLEADPTALVRFTNEARAAASIKSPHVASTSDHGVTDEGEPYIVMELLDGETLHDRLRRDGPLEPLAVATMIAQVCRGLAAAHELGILHRDIKPENVFLCAGAEPQLVKIIDFGLAKITGGDSALMPTAAGAQVGTPAFMSPEQIDAEATVDHRADLWGTAVVTYHALTGKHPFRGKNVAEFCDNIHNRVFTPVSHHRPELPPAIDAWFDRALQPEPDARFDDAIELADALIEALGVTTELPAIPTARASLPSLSGLRAPRISQSELAPPSDPPAQRMSLETLEVQREMQRRTVFLVALCVALFGVVVVLALR